MRDSPLIRNAKGLHRTGAVDAVGLVPETGFLARSAVLSDRSVGAEATRDRTERERRRGVSLDRRVGATDTADVWMGFDSRTIRFA